MNSVYTFEVLLIYREGLREAIAHLSRLRELTGPNPSEEVGILLMEAEAQVCCWQDRIRVCEYHLNLSPIV